MPATGCGPLGKADTAAEDKEGGLTRDLGAPDEHSHLGPARRRLHLLHGKSCFLPSLLRTPWLLLSAHVFGTQLLGVSFVFVLSMTLARQGGA